MLRARGVGFRTCPAVPMRSQFRCSSTYHALKPQLAARPISVANASQRRLRWSSNIHVPRASTAQPPPHPPGEPMLGAPSFCNPTCPCSKPTVYTIVAQFCDCGLARRCGGWQSLLRRCATTNSELSSLSYPLGTIQGYLAALA